MGRVIRSLEEALRVRSGLWRYVAVHAEKATHPTYAGGFSMEEVFVHIVTGEYLYRHTIVRDEVVLHETHRRYGKFGAG